jgi:hypothetical protein
MMAIGSVGGERDVHSDPSFDTVSAIVASSATGQNRSHVTAVGLTPAGMDAIVPLRMHLSARLGTNPDPCTTTNWSTCASIVLGHALVRVGAEMNVTMGWTTRGMLTIDNEALET